MLAQLVERNDGIVEVSGSIPLRSKVFSGVNFIIYRRMKKSLIVIRSLQIALLIISFIFIERFCHQKTGGFQISKIESDHAFNPDWATPIPSNQERDHIRTILDQRYTFFSYGGQAYVFLSDDGKTVLKLFKQHHLRVPSWIKTIPLPKTFKRIRDKWVHRKEDKFYLFFNSCKIAFDDFRDYTGLIYLHLNPTDYLNQQISIVDKLGIEHKIDLDHTDFALQHRAKLPKKHFRNLRKKNDYTAAQKSLDSLIDMIVERSQKGIADRDPNIRRNCGFIGEQAVEIDLGSYTRSETLKIPFMCKADIYQKSFQLRRMISKNYPELYPHLDQRFTEILYQTDFPTP